MRHPLQTWRAVALFALSACWRHDVTAAKTPAESDDAASGVGVPSALASSGRPPSTAAAGAPAPPSDGRAVNADAPPAVYTSCRPPRESDVEAQKLIDACWAISEKLRSGSTADMRKGALDSALCLEKAILDQTDILFEPTQVSRSTMQGLLTRIREGYGRFYWDLYNEHRGCHPMCGTMYQPMHNGTYAALLEGMLRDMMATRAQYGLTGR